MILRPTRPRLLIPRRKLLLGLGALIAAPYVARAGSLSLLGAGKPPAGGGGGGGTTLVANTGAGSPNGGAFTTGAINTTGANLIIISSTVLAWTGGLPPNPTDSASNTWSACTLHGDTGAPALSTIFYYCYNPTTSATHTFTAPTGTYYIAMCVAAFSGALSAPLDQQGGQYTTASVTSIGPSSAVTPTQANELVLTNVGVNAAYSGLTVPSGFTLTDSVAFLTNGHYGGALAYQKQTTATAVTPTWSWTGTSTQTATSVATFKCS